MHTNVRYLHTHRSMQNVMITKTKESIYSLFQNSPHVHTTRERTFTKQICYITICFSGIWEKASKVYRYSLYHIYKEKRLYFDDIKKSFCESFLSTCFQFFLVSPLMRTIWVYCPCIVCTKNVLGKMCSLWERMWELKIWFN